MPLGQRGRNERDGLAQGHDLEQLRGVADRRTDDVVGRPLAAGPVRPLGGSLVRPAWCRQSLGGRARFDIAALRVDDSGLPPLHSRDGLAEARVGDHALAVGADEAVAVGSIEALDDPATVTGGSEVAVVRTDADVPPSSVGGPLVNDRGEVLGVLTVTDAGTGAAVPVDVARDAALGIVRAESAWSSRTGGVMKQPRHVLRPCAGRSRARRGRPVAGRPVWVRGR
ncbi:trypsin-like peptidase domain-containing protein [Haloactinopolyspora alba]|uniref:trypsin-like peptidase domain-containing protein n=1 Tax=Haloactinopolyspora alba TaxID=648780 RepID=UPI003CC830FF